MNLPTPMELAKVLSSVTQWTFHTKTVHGGAPPKPYQTALVRAGEGRGFTVAVSTDEAGCRLLASQLFVCAPDDVSKQMTADVLAEIANVTASQLKSIVGITAPLLPPEVVEGILPRFGNTRWHHYDMRTGETSLSVSLSVSEGDS